MSRYSNEIVISLKSKPQKHNFVDPLFYLHDRKGVISNSYFIQVAYDGKHFSCNPPGSTEFLRRVTNTSRVYIVADGGDRNPFAFYPDQTCSEAQGVPVSEFAGWLAKKCSDLSLRDKTKKRKLRLSLLVCHSGENTLDDGYLHSGLFLHFCLWQRNHIQCEVVARRGVSRHRQIDFGILKDGLLDGTVEPPRIKYVVPSEVARTYDKKDPVVLSMREFRVPGSKIVITNNSHDKVVMYCDYDKHLINRLKETVIPCLESCAIHIESFHLDTGIKNIELLMDMIEKKQISLGDAEAEAVDIDVSEYTVRHYSVQSTFRHDVMLCRGYLDTILQELERIQGYLEHDSNYQLVQAPLDSCIAEIRTILGNCGYYPFHPSE